MRSCVYFHQLFTQCKVNFVTSILSFIDRSQMAAIKRKNLSVYNGPATHQWNGHKICFVVPFLASSQGTGSLTSLHAWSISKGCSWPFWIIHQVLFCIGPLLHSCHNSVLSLSLGISLDNGIFFIISEMPGLYPILHSHTYTHTVLVLLLVS